MERAGGEIGGRAAPVVTQWKRLGEAINLNLIVGGYCRKKSNEEKIEDRRHELYSMGAGWQSEKGRVAIEWAITNATSAKDYLIRELKFIAKDTRNKKIRKSDPRKSLGSPINELGLDFFYQRTQELIEGWLIDMLRSDRRAEQIRFMEDLSQICRKIFEEVTDPYCQNPALIRTVALAKRSLNFDLNKLKEPIAP